MILRRLPLLRAPLLLVMATPVLLSACWLPPREVIKEKAAARKAWRAQEKQRKTMIRTVPKEAARVVEAGRRAPRIATVPAPPPSLTATLPEEDAGSMAMTSQPEPVRESGNAATKVTPVASADTAPKPGFTDAPTAAAKPPKAKAKDAPAAPVRQMGQLTPIDGMANMVAVTRPSSPLAANAPWQDGAAPALLTRIDGWQAQFDGDKAALLAGGEGVQIAKQGRLFDTDAAMLYGMIPPGLYDCRLIQINAAGAPWHEGTSGKCRVFITEESRRISFITTQETPLGDLHENDGFSSVYLGRGMVAAMGGLGMGDGAEIGLVQRIADTRWRIILPMDGGGSAVVDVTRPRMAE